MFTNKGNVQTYLHTCIQAEMWTDRQACMYACLQDFIEVPINQGKLLITNR